MISIIMSAIAWTSKLCTRSLVTMVIKTLMNSHIQIISAPTTTHQHLIPALNSRPFKAGMVDLFRLELPIKITSVLMTKDITHNISINNT